MKFRPLADRVLIEPLEAAETTTGGIVLPDSAKEKPTQGRIVAVGPGVVREDGTRTPADAEVGDVVLYGEYSGTDVSLDDKDVRVLREYDILAKVKQ
jgi:chaperonin GroES